MRISATAGPKKKYVYEFTAKYAIKNVAMIGRRRPGPVFASEASCQKRIDSAARLPPGPRSDYFVCPSDTLRVIHSAGVFPEDLS
jgi:hypothetical protein